MHVLLRCCFSLFPMLFLPLPDGSPWQQHLCHGAASRHRAPASSISATAAPLASSIFPMAFRRSAPASNKPHPAEKSTPVWLAIWRTWAGFANSQHRDAAFATPDNICAHSSLLPHWAAAQTDANLSAYLDRLPTPPSYLRRMRLSPGRGRRCWVLGEVAAWPGAAFLQITFHAGYRHTHFLQGVAWMVRSICAHRAQLQKLITSLLGIYILEAWKVICRKATFTIPDLPFPSSRAQNQGFCSFLAFRTIIFRPLEHKIGVFVRFWGLEPSLLGFSSTKSAFLCAIRLWNPDFPAVRAQKLLSRKPELMRDGKINRG